MRRLTPLVISLVILLAAPIARPDAKTDAAIEARLKRARDAFHAAVDAAKRRLRDEYDSASQAYARTGDLDKAVATRRARDQVTASTTMPAFDIDADRPDVDADGWAILFRSPDPLVWNIAVRNRTMTAVPVAAAPPGVRYLRLRRLDTNEAVIVPCTNDQLTSRTWPIDHPAFRGDRCLTNNARLLGIVDPRNPAAVPSQTPILDVTPNGQLSGWGFAIRNGAQDSVWDSKPIPPTTFEIAVLARDLSPDEQKLLVGK
jgi:hypothetical protein